MHSSVLQYNLAQIFRRTGQLREAEREYTHLLAIDPNMAEYRVEYAEVLARLGETESSLAELDLAALLEPAFHSVSDMRGWLLMEAGSFDAAVAVFESAERQFGVEPARSYNLAYCLLQSGRHAELPMRADTFVKCARYPDIAMVLAQAYLDLGDYRAGLRTLEDATGGSNLFADQIASVNSMILSG